jgi:hypothetical protein
MKPVLLKPLFFLVAFLLLTGLACSAVSGSATQPPAQTHAPTKEVLPTATEKPVQLPTKEPTATNVPPTDVPTTEAAPAAQDFFTDEFDGSNDINNWTYWINYGDANGVSLNVDNGQLIVRHESLDTSVYVFYTPYTYSDVILELESENRGKNNNNISLVCRYNDQDQSWYEFSIANNGLYWIYAVTDGKYNELFSGGSNLINQGKELNVYTVGCVGDVLTLFINGKEARTLQDKKYKLQEGLVGLNVTSFNVTPIEVAFEYFTIAPPK